MHNKEEILDLVDEEGNVIATKPRSEVFDRGLRNFRLVITCIRKGKNFLIPRRAYHRTYPGALTNLGGCVQSGEAYENALYRLAQERLGADIREKNLRFLGYLTPKKDNTMGYVALYEIIDTDDLSISPNKDYYAEVLWLSPEQIKERLSNKNETFTPNFPIIMRKFYGIK
jgi:isopentenyldiphosphate isomerase